MSGAGSRRHRTGLVHAKPKKLDDVRSDINVTPLVDVCLVLLIIFMVVAPAIADGAHIELPKVEAADPKTKDPNAIEVGMAADGTVLLEKKPVAAKDFVAMVTELHKQDEARSVLLNVDKDV